MRPLRPVLAALLLAATAAPLAAADPAGALRPTPAIVVPPLASPAAVAAAVARLDGIVADAMAHTGVPGVAVAVVHDDTVVYARGFGVREAGRPEPVDRDTVFLLASVSKPIAATIVAAEVGRGRLAWDEPVRRHLPGFTLGPPAVAATVSAADLLSHRSGLRTSSGDLLEDLGYDRAYILGHLGQQPLDAFRSTYHYTNFAFTAGALAAAAAAGTDWETLADTALFRPLGMTRSSYRHADYRGHANRARLHVRRGAPDAPRWEAVHERDADAQAPAGGASASIDDLARFLRLHLNGGTVDGVTVVDPEALATTHLPHQRTGPPRDPLGRPGFYGLGWNVGYDARGRLEINHSGAFYLGAATHVALVPGEGLGIAVLTNGEPVGVPEAIARAFLDTVDNGAPTVDWLGLFGRGFAAMRAAEDAAFPYGPPPADARPPRALDGYAGRYANPYYGPARVTAGQGGLVLTLGPEAAPTAFPLTHHDADTFTFQPVGENAVPRAGVAFRRAPSGAVAAVTIDFYDRTGLGTFVRDAGP